MQGQFISQVLLYCCVIILDLEKTIELASSMLPLLPPGTDIDERSTLTGLAQAVADEYFAIAHRATGYLAQYVYCES
jgi:hypothetical protein